MIEWGFPWALVLLPVPWLLSLVLRRLSRRRDHLGGALRVPFFTRLTAAHDTGRGPGTNRLADPGIIFVWLLLVAALARPQWLAEPVAIPTPTRDFLVAVDISQSMETSDMGGGNGQTASRFEAVKGFLGSLVATRKSERFGLITFASAPYLQVPFTLDRALFLRVLDDVDVGMAGPRTMLGDGIGLAIRHFAGAEEKQGRLNAPVDKVLLLITDGVDSGSDVPVPEAARVAAARGITIHTVLVGRDGQSGAQAIDPELLQEVSAITGGRFFRARDERSLAEVGKVLDRVAAEQQAFTEYRPRRELYYWPLGAALCAFMVLSLVRTLRRKRNAGEAPDGVA